MVAQDGRTPPGGGTAPVGTRPDGAGAPVIVRGIELGRGRPEIIVPLVGADERALLAQTEAACASSARLLEWRLDLFRPDLADTAAHRRAVLAALPVLRERMGEERALLATFRTSAEGGTREIADDDLAALLLALLAEPGGAVDLVDIETAREERVVAAVVEAAHAVGAAVVGSFHDFAGTPPQEALESILRGQRRAGADVRKIAVTPRDARDVLALLGASTAVAADGEGPHIAISMGSLGAVSRIAAETFGSAATFAAVGGGSAPGQLGADDVARMIALLRP
ncbi:type I 3-dehydroquinate dehydratase [Brachybacterium sp. DNPG3]